MADRQHLILHAFSAYDAGDLDPFRTLLDPQAKWVGVPQGPSADDTPVCRNREAILGRFAAQYENERRFTPGKMIEQGDRVAVHVTVVNPAWSAPVELFRVFTFSAGGDVVVRMNDCIDESYALQALAM